MPTIGSGAREIRIRDEAGAFRAFYVAMRAEAIYVLHNFHKKASRTSRRDLEIGMTRYKDMMRGTR